MLSGTGTGTSASPVRFEYPDESLGPKHTVEVSIPDENSFETFENSSDFKKLAASKRSMKSFRNILLITPFAASTLLLLSSTDSSKIAQAMPASTQQTQSKLSGHEEFDAKDCALALNHALGFLWSHQSKLLHPIPRGVTSDPKTMLWAGTAHSTVLLPKSPDAPANSECNAPSTHTLAQLRTSLHDLSDALLKSSDSKNDRKGKLECLESLSQRLMLSASAKSARSLVTAPSPSCVELLNYSSATRARVSFSNESEQKGCELGTRLAMIAISLFGS